MPEQQQVSQEDVSQNQQAPVDTPDETNSDANATQDLDTLLSDFEASAAADTPQPAADDTQNQTQQYHDPRVDQLLAQQAATAAKQGIDDAVSQIKEAGANYPDRLIRGYLHDIAAERPDLVKAFQFRDQNPAKFKQVLEAVASEIKGEVESLSLGKETDDSEAVRSAVRGQEGVKTTQEAGPSSADINKMSNKEFEAYKEGLLAEG